ncbi:MAG: anthranilate synthase component I [Planctomycetota bacterium]
MTLTADHFAPLFDAPRPPTGNRAATEDAPDLPIVAMVHATRRLLSDVLTPVSAYRALVRDDDRHAPSFLFESVLDGSHVGRHSFLGHRPVAEVIAYGHTVTLCDHRRTASNPSSSETTFESDNPLEAAHGLTRHYHLVHPPDDQASAGARFRGGWVGHVGYDTVRYLESESLPSPPPDDRGLPDLHLQLYRDVVAFDHVQKTIDLTTHVTADEADSPAAALALAQSRLDRLQARLLSDPRPPLQTPAHEVTLEPSPPVLPPSNMGPGGYQRAVETCKAYIHAGDAFQIVPSQRFALTTPADPFDVYRALRVINPSPYMFYLQVRGAMLVGSSPEILVNVTDGVATSRPLAGTRHRGRTPDQDDRLADELRSAPKDRAEHIMLVDLHRNDIGRVAVPGSVELPELLAVEKYSHVMHLSSTVTGRLQPGLSPWDALRVSLPVGTVSGAPKVRAMQIIDELEPHRRGPYGGAVGYADLAGNLDMCIALRTMVITPARPATEAEKPAWTVHIQAGAGIVADSDPDAEHQETVNKAAALARAVELAEKLFDG